MCRMVGRRGKKFIKNKDFLSQIPNWEKEYKRSAQIHINYTREDWKKAEAVFTNKRLEILGEIVMEDWETPYMRALADIVTANGGTILEIGFGMGISSAFIQQHKIEKHIIIEANKKVAAKAREFAKRAVFPTEILEGLWQDVIDGVPDESIDGILFDSYPLTEDELYQNHFIFFKTAHKKLKRGGYLPITPMRSSLLDGCI